jgi:sensor histidine kinase YesM
MGKNKDVRAAQGTNQITAGRYKLAWIMVFFGAVFLAILLTIASIMGARLLSIEKQAIETAETKIPETVSQNQQALKAEILARHADIELYTIN